jgi:hypothetical protein
MEIKVSFNHGKLTFSPDPAIVRRGTIVNWRFQTSVGTFPKLRWIVYFNKGSPFRVQNPLFVADTSSAQGQHIGTSGQMSADDPGDYKYGVRVIDSSIHETIGDDDPRLIVE